MKWQARWPLRKHSFDLHNAGDSVWIARQRGKELNAVFTYGNSSAIVHVYPDRYQQDPSNIHGTMMAVEH